MIFNGIIPPRPASLDAEDQARVEQTATRRRLLTGAWSEDLELELEKHINCERRAAWGIADMSSNPFLSICRALSALYDEQPMIGITGADIADTEALLSKDGILEKSGLWPMMQTVQVLTLGLNDCLLRIDITDEKDGLFYRIVTPDMVTAYASPGNPTKPIYIHELRLRGNKDTKEVGWTVDVYDLRDKNNPLYQVRKISPNGELGEDISKQFFGESLSGDAYPYRDKTGAPYLPWSLYHAQINGNLFSPWENIELLTGSLNSSVLYTNFLHCIKNCAFPQRYISGLYLGGTSVYDTDNAARRTAIAGDPASILCFTPDPDITTQPMVGQFQSGGDPRTLLESITIYERRLAVYMQISPSDIVKSSGDPRSGFAISLSQSAKRDAQRRYAPIFRYSDRQTLKISAMLANQFLGMDLPEKGYRIRYQAVPLSPTELKEQREDILAKMNAGLLGPLEAIMQLNPDFDENEAGEYLRKVRKERIEFGL